MKNTIYLGALVVVLGLLAAAVSAQTVDKRVAAIRQIYDQTNQKVAECEEQGEYSTTYLIELETNKNNGSFPAVGIYRPVVKFFYTYGDREKNPYPDRLLKIEIGIKRSDRSESYEFLYDETGRLIFYFAKTEDAENRVYLTNDRPVKILSGAKELKLNGQAALELVRNALAENKKLVAIFRNSLDF